MSLLPSPSLRVGFALAALAALGWSCGDTEDGATLDTAVAEDADGTSLVDTIPDTSVLDTGSPFDTGTTPPPDTTSSDDVVIVPGGFLAPCQGNVDCDEGYCVEGEAGFFCTKTCLEECPQAMDCKTVLSGGVDPVFLCLPRLKKLCVPCTADLQCTGGACLTLDGSGQCGYACEDPADCLEGYACLPDPTGSRPGDFCQPRSGSCSCTPELTGAVRTCLDTNGFGTCYGVETCDAEVGWVDCTARQPTVEVCDGVDNDCNGLVDDGVATGGPCANTVEGVGSCDGVEVCLGPQGVVCTAPTPTLEVCDNRDNDCDGVVDEGFRDTATGLYSLDDAHCGACGVSCAGAIPNATAGCRASGGIARCEVVACDPVFFQAGPLTCLAVTDELCTPCQSDANCPTIGDRCLALDGGGFCGRDCGPDNAHGLAAGVCPDGFACAEVAGGPPQCRPTSSSCSCLPPDAGASRTCLRTNDLGTCYGQETCNPAVGWVGCSVSMPAPEICDGLDNDCNGGIDDVPGRGASCTNTNTHGSCPGVRDCVAGGGPELACVGRIPAAETCNYIDDNCDGKVDGPWEAALLQSCTEGLGICQRFGIVQCRPDGTGTQCSAVAGTPGVEICDGLDNDCNGIVDDAWAEDKGELCEVGTGACRAFGNSVCNAAGDGLECDAIQGTPGTEICDLIDNNCDGVIDDGFQVDGRYITDKACGNCFTDCTEIFGGAAGGYGQCDTAPILPRCELTCCRVGDDHAACTDNQDHFDLNGVPDDGCEFTLDPLAVYVSTSDPLAIDNGSCGLAPSQAGGANRPCKTIAHGITRAQALPRPRVLVASGAYVGSLTVVDGVSLYGGYSALTWQRDPSVHLTLLFGNTASGHRKTLVASGINVFDTVVDGFTIYGQVANGFSENSYAVYVRGSNAKLKLTNNRIFGGTAGGGAPGSRGDDGDPGGHGQTGNNAFDTSHRCFGECNTAGASNPGGDGGENTSCSGANGGRGGHGDCPDYDETRDLCATSTTVFNQQQTTAGEPGQGPGGGDEGKGGCDSIIHPTLTDCDCALPGEDEVNCPFGPFSAPGSNGAMGLAGEAGTSCGSVGGEVNSATGEWGGNAGFAASAGSPGGGGGGGGAGGGIEQFRNPQNTCDTGGSDFGGSGGGGGAGGCGSQGGGGGGPGGGAFGIFVRFNSTQLPLTSFPDVTGNTVHTGFGGAGGRGGDSGTPGLGGNGGNGGGGGVAGTDYWCANPGSKGGEGGAGGSGGGGGGGCGGVSYGIYVSGQGNASITGWTNVVLLDGQGGAGGVGGLTAPGGTGGPNGGVGTHGMRNF